MQHSYFTGASLGMRVAYNVMGGTDSLTLAVNNNVGSYTVISDSSSYGSRALRIDTTSTAGDMCAVRTTNPTSQTERRSNIVIDIPMMSAGQFVAVVNEGNTGGSFYIHLYQSGAWAVFCNGSAQYTSSTGQLPAAGTTIRISYALGINGTSSSWRVGLFVDATDMPIGSTQTGTVSWSGTFWSNGYVGKALGQSATSTSLTVRAIRVESGSGCSLALLPNESLLTPSEGASIVPIRFVSYSGTAPSPTGQGAVTNLADNNNGTTVTITTGSSIRVALRPMNVVGPYLTFNLYQLALTAAGNISVNLWKASDGTQVGTTKTVAVATSAADATVTFSASELSGLTTADWEAMELEVVVP